MFAEDGLVRLALHFALPLVGDLAGHGAGHVQLVDVQAGLAEGRHGGVHACIAVGGAAERGQVQGLAPRDDGDVERELAAAVRRGRLGDGEGRRGGELAAGAWRRGRLAVEEFAVLAAGEEQLQGTAGRAAEKGREKEGLLEGLKLKGMASVVKQANFFFFTTLYTAGNIKNIKDIGKMYVIMQQRKTRSRSTYTFYKR